MTRDTIRALKRLIQEYDTVIKVMDGEALDEYESGNRAYGGVIPSAKGKVANELKKFAE